MEQKNRNFSFLVFLLRAVSKIKNERGKMEKYCERRNKLTKQEQILSVQFSIYLKINKNAVEKETLSDELSSSFA